MASFHCKSEKTQNIFILSLENASKLHLDKYNVSAQESKKGDFSKTANIVLYLSPKS